MPIQTTDRSPGYTYRIRLLYATVGFLGLAFPVGLFDAVRTPLYGIAKRFR